uniref:Orexin-like 2 n=1 Tax=Stichopus japonicus TaxID=307972 RepID=A0A2Z4C088_STIJA|nr:orexin-like precursor 2 [Apostichopus japonicus]
MKSPWYILQVIVLLIILATCFSLTNAQGGCCSKIRDCNIPAGCFCPLKKAVCSGGANRHFISGKRSDIRWNYPNRAGDDWDEYKYLMRQDKHTDRQMSVRRLIRTLIDRLDVNPDLLMMALTKGDSNFPTTQQLYEES